MVVFHLGFQGPGIVQNSRSAQSYEFVMILIEKRLIQICIKWQSVRDNHVMHCVHISTVNARDKKIITFYSALIWAYFPQNFIKGYI